MITIIFEIEEKAPQHIVIRNPVLEKGGTALEKELARLVCIAGSLVLKNRTAETSGGEFNFTAKGGPSAQSVSAAVRGEPKGGA